ncbi:unnamed protein product [Brassica oleracea var. botrytis]|uniref:Zinc finger PHD-type domain-containing protein n=2 Tax=Brassica oleracea TaxID=3712 RepID=A0A0D3E3I6_BRAOL|nr:PREDICTED: uncharacterized protein LOC106313151 [Brassica oleracea var. oleracea]VDD29058.1 unnamed protein product [Brassica oleracea]
MEKVDLPVHNHPLLPLTRFSLGRCKGCWSHGYIYGGYRCNELGCDTLFHKECAESLPDINHSSHPDHPLKLVRKFQSSICSLCQVWFDTGYFCSICDFKLDLGCAWRPSPPLTLENTNTHEHQLVLSNGVGSELSQSTRNCKVCSSEVLEFKQYYECHQCELVFHVKCTKISLEEYHTSHPEHPLKFLTGDEAPGYADKKCLLCGVEFNQELHHCDVCNFSICRGCAGNPPPLSVMSSKTHEHQLHLFPRLVDFTCNACGTRGEGSPYLCFQCKFMIHRDCIDLPRIININRHDHCISYTRRLGHGDWTCGVCREKVDGFHGAYSCSVASKCSSSYVVHSKCATRKDVWDQIELEGTAEEEEVSPFEVVDDTTIKHFSHEHCLWLIEDGRILQENKLCEACVFQIQSESFYSCEQCDYILHERCANISIKKRHVCHSQPFTLHTSSGTKTSRCALCERKFTGFMYKSASHKILDVRCGSISEPFEHDSHPHPLYYSEKTYKHCSAHGGGMKIGMLSCDECDYSLDFRCALLPKMVVNHRYDDHPLFLSYGDSYVWGEYWCEACETKVNPKKWYYTCNECGVVLHISCVVGDFSYITPVRAGSLTRSNKEVVPNTCVCRKICSTCNSRCKLPSVLKVSKPGVDSYYCSNSCDTSYLLI